MNSAGFIIETILAGLIALYLVRITITYLVCQSFFSGHDDPDPTMRYEPRVSVIKPIWGLDENALDNFRSFCEQDYPNRYEIIFCAENRNDPSIPVIQKVIGEYPEKEILLAFSDPDDKRWFGKVKNMIAGLRESKYEVLLFSDSDVSVPKTFIRQMTGSLKDPETGLAYCPPFSSGARDWKAAMLNMAVNENTMNIILLHRLGTSADAVGTTMAVRREVIEEVGGLEPIGRQVTDDLPLARAIRRKGYKIHLLHEPARVYHPHDTFIGWWKHMVRWMVMIRRYMPAAAYTGISDMPLLLSLLYWGIAKNMPAGVILTGGVLLVRLGYSALIHMKFVHDKEFCRHIWAIPLLELLKLPLLIRSYLTNRIEWRGRKMYVNRNGTVRLPW